MVVDLFCSHHATRFGLPKMEMGNHFSKGRWDFLIKVFESRAEFQTGNPGLNLPTRHSIFLFFIQHQEHWAVKVECRYFWGHQIAASCLLVVESIYMKVFQEGSLLHSYTHWKQDSKRRHAFDTMEHFSLHKKRGDFSRNSTHLLNGKMKISWLIWKSQHRSSVLNVAALFQTCFNRRFSITQIQI